MTQPVKALTPSPDDLIMTWTKTGHTGFNERIDDVTSPCVSQYMYAHEHAHIHTHTYTLTKEINKQINKCNKYTKIIIKRHSA